MKSKPIIRRQDTVTIADLLLAYVKETGLEGEFVKLRICEEWDMIVAKMGRGIGIGRYFKDGILYCTISSSAIRNIIYYDLPGIIRRINDAVPGGHLKKIVLR